MNDTFRILSSYFEKRKTRTLANKIGKLCSGHEHLTVIAALLNILVQAHIDANIDEEDVLCIQCSNVGLTELLQSIRRVNDEMIESIPSKEGEE